MDFFHYPLKRLNPASRVQAFCLVVMITCCIAGGTRQAEAGGGEPARAIALSAIDFATSQPLAGVKVEVRFTSQTTDLQLTTDAAGRAMVRLPDAGFTWNGEEGCWMTNFLQLGIEKPGYVRVEKTWYDASAYSPTRPSAIAGEQTIYLEPVVPVGGMVVDEAGKSLEGAEIYTEILFDSQNGMMGRPRFPHFEGHTRLAAAPCRSDRQGRWTYRNLPQVHPEEREVVWVHARHPEYEMPDGITDEGYGRIRNADYEELRQGRLKITMRRTCGTHVAVRDSGGRPIRDAQIAYHDESLTTWYTESVDHEQGIYTVSHIPKGDGHVLITAKGFGPSWGNVKVDHPFPTMTFTLEAGQRIHGQAMDQFGKPYSGLRLEAKSWHGQKNISLITLRTDGEGRFEWNEAPGDDVTFEYYNNDYKTVAMRARKEPYIIRVSRNLRVRGQVSDAQTSTAVSQFKITPGIETGPGQIDWNGYPVDFRQETSKSLLGSAGAYVIWLKRPDKKQYLKVESPGYQTAISRAFENEAGEATYDFKLKPVTRESAGESSGPFGLRGVLLRPDGSPLANAQAGFYFGRADPALDGIVSQEKDISAGATTDGAGRFNVQAPAPPFVVQIGTMEGIGADLTDRDLDRFSVNTIRLERPKEIKCVVYFGKNRSPARLIMEPYRVGKLGPTHDWGSGIGRPEANSQGEFSVYRLHPEEVKVGVMKTNGRPDDYGGERESFTAFVRLDPEAKGPLVLGGPGRTVTGCVARMAERKKDLQWDFCGAVLRSWPEAKAIPATPGEAELAHRWRMNDPDSWHEAWAKVDSREWNGRRWCYSVRVDEQGRFKVPNVRPGQYDLILTFTKQYPVPNNPGALTFSNVGYARAIVEVKEIEGKGTEGKETWVKESKEGAEEMAGVDVGELEIKGLELKGKLGERTYSSKP